MNKDKIIRVKSCRECQNKHHKCEISRPCRRCKQLNLNCDELVQKSLTNLTFTHLNVEDLYGKYKTNSLTKVDILKNYKFKVNYEKLILSNFNSFGKIISIDFPIIDYVSPELLTKLKIIKLKNNAHLKDILGESTFKDCISIIKEEMILKMDLMKKKSRNQFKVVTSDTRRIVISDSNGEIFEMVKECIKIYKEDNPIHLEAIIIQLFWV